MTFVVFFSCQFVIELGDKGSNENAQMAILDAEQTSDLTGN